VGYAGQNARIWANSTRFDAPGHDSHLNTVHKEWTTRITAALTLSAAGIIAANVGVVDLVVVDASALLVVWHKVVDLLQNRLDNPSGLVQTPSDQSGRGIAGCALHAVRQTNWASNAVEFNGRVQLRKQRVSRFLSPTFRPHSPSTPQCRSRTDCSGCTAHDESLGPRSGHS
jgi:hypothetical protein